MTDFDKNTHSDDILKAKITPKHQHDNQTSDEVSLGQTVLGVVLVLLETLLTLLLRADSNLRQVMYPLAKNNTVVCIRSYVPHTTIYATFTINGVLLDSELPHNKQVDVTINGFTWEVVLAMFSQQAKAVEKLQFRGEIDKVSQVKAFFVAIGVINVVQEMIAKFTGKKQTKSEKPKKTEQEFRQKIDEQKQQINALTVKNAEVQTALAELKSQNKTLKITLGVVTVLFLAICAWVVMR